MAATETQVRVSKEVRKQLRIIQAEEEEHTYNAAIRHLLNQRENA